MSILSPSDRVVLWQTVITSDAQERPSLLKVLAREILETAGRRLDLYGGYQDEVIATVESLDTSGLLGRDDLRMAFEEADADDEHAETFAALVAEHLKMAADMPRLGVDDRLRAMRLAEAWRRHVLDRSREPGRSLSVAQVAARYGVTPQAVYKWIKAGRVQAEQTPGGSWRLPADQFERPTRTDRDRLARLRARLVEHVGDADDVSDEALAEEIVRRRRS